MTRCLKNKNQLAFHFLEGAKFKTNIIGLLIRTPLCKETATKTALLAEVLKNGCKAYPTRQAVAKAMDELYGGVFDVSVLKKGDEQILFFYLEVLKKPEDLLEKAFLFLQQYLAMPLAEEGAFLDKAVQREKKTLKNKIQGRKDDKREYAKDRCIEILAEGQPFGIYGDGYEKDISQIDGESLYTHYRQMMDTGVVELLFCGERAQLEKVEELSAGFDFLGARRKGLPPVSPLPHKKRCEKKETMDVAQGRLCMAFTSDIPPNSPKFYTLLVANEILGGGASSLLFRRIREEQGLCYYINTILLRMKSVLLVQTGIRTSDFQKTTEAVETACEELKQAQVEQEQLDYAKAALTRYFNSMEDSPTALMNWKMDETILDTHESISDVCRLIHNVTPDAITEVVKTLRLGAVYFLHGREENKNADS